MARELIVSAAIGLQVYAVGRVLNGDNIGLWGNIDDNQLEVYAATHFPRYDTPMPELGASGFYEADFPSVFNGERAVEIIFYSRLQNDPLETDTKLSGSLYEFADDWVATQTLTV